MGGNCFFDLGLQHKFEHYKVVPKTRSISKGWFELSVSRDSKRRQSLSRSSGLHNKKKRSQPFVYLEAELKFVGIERLYLETKKIIGTRRARLLLLTEEGLILYETEYKNINFKHA